MCLQKLSLRNILLYLRNMKQDILPVFNAFSPDKTIDSSDSPTRVEIFQLFFQNCGVTIRHIVPKRCFWIPRLKEAGGSRA